MTDDRKLSDEADDAQPDYCQHCGDPITGSDQFCAGCGAPAAKGNDPVREESPEDQGKPA